MYVWLGMMTAEFKLRWKYYAEVDLYGSTRFVAV